MTHGGTYRTWKKEKPCYGLPFLGLLLSGVLVVHNETVEVGDVNVVVVEHAGQVVDLVVLRLDDLHHTPALVQEDLVDLGLSEVGVGGDTGIANSPDTD